MPAKKEGEKDKVWTISEVINGKEIVLKHIKDKKDIKYKEQGEEHLIKIEILSDNEISGELLEKIKKMTVELQKNLPESYKLESEFSKTSQSITFVWPLKMDKKTHVEALTHFSAFAKKLKQLLSSSTGSKSLRKHITITPKEKDTKD